MTLSFTYWWSGFAVASAVTICQCSSRSCAALPKSRLSLGLLFAAIAVGMLLSLAFEEIGITRVVNGLWEGGGGWIVIRPQGLSALSF